jgi:hypothetical protein
MGSRITTTCPTCGTVVLDPQDLTVVTSTGEHAWYVFDCTGCADQVVKDAPPAVVEALAHIRVPVCRRPAEMDERAAHPQSKPLDADSLLDAVLLLRSTDLLAALAAQLAP